MQTGSRARVAATLREYLKCEYKHKMNEDREFNKENMKGCCPKVPQQPNFSDCGLFLLQYVESLFKSPIQDFSLPIKSLKKWFPNQEMRNKRHDIAKLIRELAAEQHKDKKINFPPINFTPTEGSGYTDDEDGGKDNPVTRDEDEGEDEYDVLDDGQHDDEYQESSSSHREVVAERLVVFPMQLLMLYGTI